MFKEDFKVGDQGHINDLNGKSKALNSAIYSRNYPVTGLQGAYNDAVTYKRPLVIAPGLNIISAPLLMNGSSNIHISAYGATIQPDRDMPSLLDMRDCTRCTWHGGWFNVPTGRTVANAIYVYRNSGQATRNTFQDVTIEGDYSVGLRVGKTGDTGQCDHMWFDRIEFIGRGLPGQVGAYVGAGIYGNCLNHTFTNLMATLNETHVQIEATNVYVNFAFFSFSTQDIKLTDAEFSIQNVRSENAGRFLVGGGPASYGVNWSIRDVLWLGQLIASDGYWLKTSLPGGILLDNVRLMQAAVAPRVKVLTGAAMIIEAHRLTTNWQFSQPSDAFDVLPNTGVDIKHFIQLNTDSSVASVT